MILVIFTPTFSAVLMRVAETLTKMENYEHHDCMFPHVFTETS